MRLEIEWFTNLFNPFSIFPLVIFLSVCLSLFHSHTQIYTHIPFDYPTLSPLPQVVYPASILKFLSFSFLPSSLAEMVHNEPQPPFPPPPPPQDVICRECV